MRGAGMTIGIMIDGSKKIYYYRSNKYYAIGRRIKIKAPSGGHFDAEVVSVSDKPGGVHLKELVEVS